MKTKKFYYISDVTSVSEIQENGISSDEDNSIYIFTIDKGKIKDVLNIAGYIASNQLFLDEYALFEIIDSGITGKLIDHKVSGRTAQYQRIVKQENIGNEHIKFVNCYKTYFAI